MSRCKACDANLQSYNDEELCAKCLEVAMEVLYYWNAPSVFETDADLEVFLKTLPPEDD